MPEQSAPEPVAVTVAASFNAQPIAEVIDFWAQRAGFPVTPVIAAEGQVIQHLVNVTSPLHDNRQGVNVAAVRVSDLLPTDDVAIAAAAQAMRELASSLLLSRQRSNRPTIAVVCPEASNGVGAEVRDTAMRALREEVSDEIVILASEDIIRRYAVDNCFDPYAEAIANSPYTHAFNAALGTSIFRAAHALLTPRPKVLAVDCDGTLWDGVVGEDGADNIVIGAERRAIHRFLAAQQQAGRLICLCSKNDEADVRAVFAGRPDLDLNLEQVVSLRVNWQPKSRNIRDLSAELNVALDTFVFIDDNPVECAEVTAGCPDVLTVRLPESAGDALETLEHTWALDAVHTTAEDSQRTRYYREEAHRGTARDGAPTLAEYITGLDLKVDLGPADATQVRRISQLTHRTNQFNCAPCPRSEQELHELPDTTGVIAVEARDRFGSYGLVGTMIVENGQQSLRVSTFLLSCRALGRGVEHAMLAHAAQMAVRRGIPWVDVDFRETSRNSAAAAFLESVTAESGGSPIASAVRFPADAVATVSYVDMLRRRPADLETRPESPPIAVRREEVGRTSAAPDPRANRFPAVEVGDLRTAAAVVRAVDAWRREQVGHQSAPVERGARGFLDAAVLQIWDEILGRTGSTRDDNFFDAGGTSLKMVHLMVRVRDVLGVELPIDLLSTTALTPGAVAEAVQLRLLDGSLPDDIDVLVDWIEGLTDEEVAALSAEGA